MRSSPNGFRFLGRDLSKDQHIQTMEELLKLFHYLLLKTHGNAQEALDWMDELKQRGYIDADLDAFREFLNKKGTVKKQPGGGVELSKKGVKELRRRSLTSIFDDLKGKGPQGDHDTPQEGLGSAEPLPELREWEFGDDLRYVDFNQSLLQQVQRTGGTDLPLEEEDLRVHETRHAVGCATVLLLDVSHSMILYGEDRFTPAKQVSLALMEMITTRFRSDSLDVVLFGDSARVVPLKELPFAQVGPFHTNTKAGLAAARRILEQRHQGQKRIFMITDGKPTVIDVPGEGIYRNTFELDDRIVNRTLDEAVICRRKNIDIHTFMVARDPWLEDFVHRLTDLNQGKAYFSSADKVGGFVLKDFVRGRKGR
jgi:Ca-activated chloride channel homolog